MAPKSQANTPATQEAAGTIQAPNAVSRLLAKMGGLAVLEEGASSRSTSDDINKILNAENEADMWDADELDRWNAQKLSGCHLQITSFRVAFAAEGGTQIENPVFIDPATGKQMFVLIESFRLDNAGKTREFRLPEPGVVFTWNTSAPRIVPKLFWMLEHGMFDSGAKPVRVQIEGTDLGGGRSVEKLKELPAGTVIIAAAPIEDTLPEDGNEPPF